MKRKDRKKLGHDSRPHPNSTSTADQKGSITGDVRIRGKATIETDLEEARARETESAPSVSSESEVVPCLPAHQDRRDRWRFRLEIISLIVLTIYAALTFWQGRSSQISANAARSAALTAKLALESSNRSWIETRLSPIWEETVISPAASEKMLDSLKQVIIPFEMTNIGHVPVTNINIQLKVELVNREESPRLDYSGRWGTAFLSILYPTRTEPFDAVLYSPGAPSSDRDIPPVEMSPALKEELLSGQKYIAAYGRGTFTDSLGKHWFKFCHWLTFADPKLRLAFTSWDCTNYNAVGDVAQQKAGK
jgi:hypothetical protein